MECPTYQLLLTHSKSAIDDEEMKKVKIILSNIPEKDYYIRIEHTPFNTIYHYTTSIIILRNSCEEAEPIANMISNLLEEHDIKSEKVRTTLLWQEPAIYFKIR